VVYLSLLNLKEHLIGGAFMGIGTVKSLILCSFLIFLVGCMFGFSILGYYKNHPSINFSFTPILGHRTNESIHAFKYIFVKNLKVILLISFGGVLTFGGVTILNLIINGMPLGISLHSAWNLRHLGELKAFFLLIFPHGVFEIPALIIAGAAGFKIPYELLRFALGKKEEIISEEDAKEFFKLVAVSIVLIFIAALIESTITAKIAEKLA